ncbi:MAG: hypothetical protein M1587_06945 [Thaumarchaeota archaeon]|nr:hypothetical protein [Nitrososphaerota archaeon]
MTENEGRLHVDHALSYEALSQLEAISSSLGLDENVREEARSVYRRAIEDELTKGAPLSTIAAASVYAVCRERSIRVDLRKLAHTTHSNVSMRCIRKYYVCLVQKLNIAIPDVITDTENYLRRIAITSGKSEDSVKLASKIIELAEKSGNATAGRHPAAVAAAALYLACIKLGQGVTEDNISDAAGVTPTALRHSLRSLRKSLA